jgi:hypothetical protein
MGSTDMSWPVGEVIAISSSGTRGHGFSIINQRRAPLVTFTYETAAEAEAAQSLVQAALTGVIDVTSYPDPRRIS